MFNEELERQVEILSRNIDLCKNFEELDFVEDKYEWIQHPHVGYKFGESYLIFKEKPSAFKYLIHSASFGIKSNNFYAKTGYANSIGQSLFYLLTQYKYGDDLDLIICKLFANSYILLSICILNMKEKAFDSCRSRAKLIRDYHMQCSDEILKRYYYDGHDICKQILSLGDFYLASIGFEKAGKLGESKKCFNDALEDFKIIKQLPQYQIAQTMELQQFSQISRQRFCNY